MSTIELYGTITDCDGGGGGGGTGVVHNHNINLSFSTNEGVEVYKPAIPPSSTPNPAPATHAYHASSSGNGTAVAVSINAATAVDGEQTKRKRGRPRKYPLDGTVTPGLTAPQPRQEGEFSPPASVAAVSSVTGKKARGSPRGSGQKQHIAPLGFLLGGGWSPGVGFMPHVITIKAGEDVSFKIMSFSQSGTQAICILSANGAISNATLRQAATSGGSVTYEGRFEILSLSGSYTVSESGGRHSRTGGLSVLLAGPDGRVLGGGVAGLLVAAAPVQELKPPIQADPLASAPPKLNHRTSAAGSPGSGDGPGSPLNQSTGAYNNSNNPPGMTTFSWK